MQLLSKVLLSPFLGPIWTTEFVIKRINEQVEDEYLDEGKVQADLLELTLQYERGEIGDDEYQEREVAILDHLNDIRVRTGQVDDAGDEVEDDVEDEASEE
ncbi:MAG TPA: gas vesicle protein GvpG [Ktedonobacterales bacterium]|nr:gas vesicle protein GvpG [Ktedonobacterales bacterium]